MSVFKLRRVLLVLLPLLVALVMAPAGLYAAPSRQPLVEPQISAKAAIVVEYPSGRILYEKNDHTRMAMASTTKIMTAILALEKGKLNDSVTFTSRDITWGSTMGLQVGEKQTLQNLLYGLMLPSGNDAATTIARYVGSQVKTTNPVRTFVNMMNTRAVQLGLKETHFINPHGLDAVGHYTSAYDMASMMWQALHFQTFNEIVKQPSYVASGHPLRNLNKMLTLYPGADGGKTGQTGAAGLCLVTTATRNGHRLISVVFNAPRWTDDSTALLDYGFAKLPAVAASRNAAALRITTVKGAGQVAAIQAAK